LKVKEQVNAVNKKAKGPNFENYEGYSFKCCGHYDQGQGVVENNIIYIYDLIIIILRKAI